MPSTIRSRLAGLRAGRDHESAAVAFYPPQPEFGSATREVVAICHPDWLGIRATTHSQGLPVIEATDLAAATPAILDALGGVGASLVVINGYPPSTGPFAEAASRAGLTVRVIMHSSMTQHGFEPAEGQVIADLMALAASGVVDRVGFSKEGQAEAFGAMGYSAVWVPQRTVSVPPTAAIGLGEGRHVGIIGGATWRKNVSAQIGAAAIMGATAHVTEMPAVPYLPGTAKVLAHGSLDRNPLLQLIASTDVNLAVTLYECFPVLPQESYLLDTPCLISRTSALFRSDEVLWGLSTVAEHDNPRAIATAASGLLDAVDREGVVERARQWLTDWNASTADEWGDFVTPRRGSS